MLLYGLGRIRKRKMYFLGSHDVFLGFLEQCSTYIWLLQTDFSHGWDDY